MGLASIGGLETLRKRCFCVGIGFSSWRQSHEVRHAVRVTVQRDCVFRDPPESYTGVRTGPVLKALALTQLGLAT